LTNTNVHRLQVEDKEIFLIGTAHVSRQSVNEVAELIETVNPDSVCVELCDSRYQTIVNEGKWKNTDIVTVIKEGRGMLLLVNLILSSYQKRLAEQFGIKPGQEMMQGIESAKKIGAELCLADRDIQVTMQRLWRSIGLRGKFKLFYQLILSFFDNEEISEEELEKMKNQDMLESALTELSHFLPQVKTVLIDERDKYLAQKIKSEPGQKIVAVLGAGHIAGIKKQIYEEHDLEQLNHIAPPSKISKIIGWSIPVLLIALIASTFTVDQATGLKQIFSWILWNGSLAALGALIAFGHPISIITAFVAAPISSLNPLLAAGWFAGLTEAWLKKPMVKDFEQISSDITSLKGFWNNRVVHILLIVATTNLGSSVGTMIGGADIIMKFINVFF
jgi:pheromone shutdown-related protein TraB